MLKVGLTGNFHSGQNEVAKIFDNLSVPVFDADLVLKYLINYSNPHITKIKSEFGENVYKIGLLNLQKFNSNTTWNKLIDLVEIDIIAAFEKFRLKHKYSTYVVFKYSYLFERRIDSSMDYNINCYRPSYSRKNDISLLTYMDSYAISTLIENELDETYKNKKSDFIVNNYITNGISVDLDNKVLKINEMIMKKIPQDNFTTSGNQYSSGFWD
jgi:dephospho-CoA kinase